MPGHPHSTGAARAGGGRFRIFSLRNGLIVLAVGSALLGLHLTDLEWRDVPELLQRVNRPLALAIMATLPVVGFPITAVYLAAGAIFGPWVGALVIASVTLVHVLVTQVLALTVLKKPVARWRVEWSKRLPAVTEGDHISVVVMLVMVPALPYVARNCLLAVSGVPLRDVVLVGVPLFTLRSFTTIYLGDASADPSLKTMLIVGTIFAVKLGISALLFHRLRKKTKRQARK
jgi:uncharacterized membrane protein YdjX (TVP38/TMEM64 family)